jgi:uncharacterized SAM-binding protein YcdF (DUF218 family)
MTRNVRLMGRVAGGLVITWLGACAVLAAVVHYTGTRTTTGRSDVIIVLGAAMTDRGEPGPALTRRAAHAVALWTSGHGGMIICTGGIGPAARVQRSEADGCRDVLVREGVPATAILLEDQSRTTAENARNARAIMARHGWSRATLVSDSYHVFRARLLCRRAGIEVELSPVPAAEVRSPLFYLSSLIREVAALHVQGWP